jgi:hypothetical protein
MKHPSEKATSSSKHVKSSTAVDHEEDIDSLSEHSFGHAPRDHKKDHDYLSTNLVAGRDLTLADVISEELPLHTIMERVDLAKARVSFRHNPFGDVDPKAQY